LVRKVASSIAVSPPPTTTTSLFLKKKPSQVAQAETPRPWSRFSFSSPSHRAEAPVAMMTARPLYTSSPTLSVNGRFEKSTSVTSSSTSSVPKRSACSRIWSISSGPMMPSRKPG
jgi:hypothetical protein